MKRACFVLALTILPLLVSADYIGGIVTQDYTLEVKAGFELNLNMTTSEIILLRLPEETRFLRGLQIEVVLSDELKRYADSFGIGIYSDIDPPPHKNERSFRGKNAFFAVLPYSNRSYVRLPVVADSETAGSETPGTLGTASVVLPSSFPILITIQPIMKGIPDPVSNRKFFLTVKQDIEKKGLMDLKLVKPQGLDREEVVVYLDDKTIDSLTFPLVLDSGLHTLRVTSDVFKNEIVNFALNPGEAKDLAIVLQPAFSTLAIESLEGVAVYLDGKKILPGFGERIQLTEGEHTIRFKLGDYSISRKFTVIKGKNFSISLLFDIKFKED